MSIKDLILIRIYIQQGVSISGNRFSDLDLISPIANGLFLFTLFSSVSRYLAVLEMRTNISTKHATSNIREYVSGLYCGRFL